MTRSWQGALAVAALLAVAPASIAGEAAGNGIEAPRGDRSSLGVPLHEAIYHASVRGIPVRAGLRLEAQGGGAFVYRSWVEPRGVASFIRKEVTESSLVALGRGGELTPLSYRRRDEFSGRGSDMRFDIEKRQVHVTYRGESTITDWEPGIYDLLSLRLVLARDLAAGVLKDTYRYIDDRSRIEEVEVTVSEPELLSTALGELETVRLEYRSERRQRMYRLWIAPGLDAALVRLEQHEEGRLRGSLNIVEYRLL